MGLVVQKAERVGAPAESRVWRHAAWRSGPRASRPVGNVTRGTTNPNRMRRVDRWLTGPQAWRLRAEADPLVVDLGYGASPATAVELFERLSVVRPDVRVVASKSSPSGSGWPRNWNGPG